MSEYRSLHLSPWYLNTRRLAILTEKEIPVVAQTSLIKNSLPRAEAMRAVGWIAEQLLQSGQLKNLNSELIRQEYPGERILGMIWGIFTFRGLPNATERERERKPYVPGSFSGTIPIGSDEFKLKGTLSNDHLYSQSSVELMSGKRRALIVGQFEFDKHDVEVFPFIVGEMVTNLAGLVFSWSGQIRVHPSQIDAFSKIQEVRPPSPTTVKKMLKISEDYVKNAFAEIIGEPFVPKDWPGEKSDLTTSRLTIRGEHTSAAIIFKGPSISREMHPADLGKRGDQLVRAFDEPADLIVIQHCNKIANSVVRQAEALAMTPSRPRRYCIIDGADTYRILEAYGKLPNLN